MDPSQESLLEGGFQLPVSKVPQALGELYELLPQVQMARIPTIRNILDFRQCITYQSDTLYSEKAELTPEHVQTAWELRELLRTSLDRVSKSQAHQDWPSSADKTIQLAEEYLEYWNQLDAVLCVEGKTALQNAPNSSSEKVDITFSWRGPLSELSPDDLMPLVEDTVLSFRNAPAFEGLMIRAAIAILYWFQASRQVFRKNLTDAVSLYENASSAFASCTRYAKTRITYSPNLHGYENTPLRCLDPNIYHGLHCMMNGASDICALFLSYPSLSDSNSKTIPSAVPAFLFTAAQWYQQAYEVVVDSLQLQIVLQQSILQTWRSSLICSILLAAEVLDVDKTKKVERHMWTISIGEAVYQYLDSTHDLPSLVKRVTDWRNYHWKQNNEVYRYNIPVATDGGGGMKAVIDILTPYLILPTEK